MVSDQKKEDFYNDGEETVGKEPLATGAVGFSGRTHFHSDIRLEKGSG